jgi:hypothetical protein
VAHAAAATLFQQAIDRLERGNHPRDAVPVYEKLGAVLLSCAYLCMGVLDRSLALSQRMLAVAEPDGDEGVASQYTVVLACTNYVRGDWHRGRELLRNHLGPYLKMFTARAITMARVSKATAA